MVQVALQKNRAIKNAIMLRVTSLGKTIMPAINYLASPLLSLQKVLLEVGRAVLSV